MQVFIKYVCPPVLLALLVSQAVSDAEEGGYRAAPSA